MTDLHNLFVKIINSFMRYLDSLSIRTNKSVNVNVNLEISVNGITKVR